MANLQSWSIPLAALIIAMGGALATIFTYLRSCRREYVQDLEKRVASLEQEVVKLIAQRNASDTQVEILTKHNHELTLEVLELRRRLDEFRA